MPVRVAATATARIAIESAARRTLKHRLAGWGRAADPTSIAPHPPLSLLARPENRRDVTPAPRILRPDPRVSARLHCTGEIEEAIGSVIAPLYRSLGELEHDPEDDTGDGSGDGCVHLWMFRDRRHIETEHLELHVHGPSVLEAEIRDRISRAWKADAPDHELVWISYRPSDVIFGGPPFQEDEGFRDGFTRALAIAGRRIAETFHSASEPLPFGRRQVVLWGLVLTGLQALALSAEQRSSYLRYHRDWLMRFPLMQQPDRDERMARLREHFDRRVAAMEGALESLRSAMGEPPEAGAEPAVPADADESERRWFQAIRTVHRVVLPLREGWDPRLDPWAERPEHAPLFKLFHIAANPLGLTLPEEAFTYHLLLRATALEMDSSAP